MTIFDARVKVSFTKEEKDAFIIVADVLKKLRVKDTAGFIWSVTDYDRIFYDEFIDETTVFEFLDNVEEEEEE